MKRFITQVLLLFCFLQMCNDVVAGVAKPLAEDPVIEARLKAMSQELRCLVCQNQTLSDSSAPLAEDLRREIRSQMREGKTDQQVIDYLVARYGDFVRYRPPVNSYTLLLWFGPFFLLLIGGFMLYRMLKKQVGNSEIQPEDL
jgi:cytochrome c-type biogenesis protein CcmH